jgi:hypothetical protein
MANSDSSDCWISAARRRLAARSMEKPATKAGQIRALWPEIRAALDRGQSMKSIRIWLEEEAGISLAITSLTSYISRIRRREAQKRQGEQGPDFHADSPPGRAAMEKSDHPPRWLATSSANHDPPPKQDYNPLAQAMKVLSRPKLDIREIHGDGDPSGKNLI